MIDALPLDWEARARRAQLLLDDDLVKEALQVLESDCFAAIRNTGLGDTAKREQAWLMLKSADRFRLYLQAIADEGKVKQAAQQALSPYR